MDLYPYPRVILLIFFSEKVSVLTLDGRTMVGTLLSCDGSMNLVLQEAVVPSEEVPLGLYIVRGDNVAVCGRVDEEIDGQIDWTKVHGEVLGSTKHV
jgi:U6 snRNA-associated Sm-like protein LSm8